LSEYLLFGAAQRANGSRLFVFNKGLLIMRVLLGNQVRLFDVMVTCCRSKVVGRSDHLDARVGYPFYFHRVSVRLILTGLA
jgi:hypothetical protein